MDKNLISHFAKINSQIIIYYFLILIIFNLLSINSINYGYSFKGLCFFFFNFVFFYFINFKLNKLVNLKSQLKKILPLKILATITFIGIFSLFINLLYFSFSNGINVFKYSENYLNENFKFMPLAGIKDIFLFMSCCIFLLVQFLFEKKKIITKLSIVFLIILVILYLFLLTKRFEAMFLIIFLSFYYFFINKVNFLKILTIFLFIISLALFISFIRVSDSVTFDEIGDYRSSKWNSSISTSQNLRFVGNLISSVAPYFLINPETTSLLIDNSKPTYAPFVFTIPKLRSLFYEENTLINIDGVNNTIVDLENSYINLNDFQNSLRVQTWSSGIVQLYYEFGYFSIIIWYSLLLIWFKRICRDLKSHNPGELIFFYLILYTQFIIFPLRINIIFYVFLIFMLKHFLRLINIKSIHRH